MILLVIIIVTIIYFIYFIFFTKVNLSNLSVVQGSNFFQIKDGETVSQVGDSLKKFNIIKSETAFKIYVKTFSNLSLVQAGIYSINKTDTLVSLANKIIKAHYAIPPVKITIPEGSDNLEIAKIISQAFNVPNNSTQLVDDYSITNISNKISNDEGYLFPETYVFLPNISLDKVISKMKSEFYYNLKNIFQNEATELGIYSLDLNKFNINDYFNDGDESVNLKKRFTIKNDIGTITVTIKDVITMASYLEGEVNNENDMRKVSGVLWNRLRLNYPLQIDAATSTYKVKGFTTTPINNPGLVAIRAAINPINTGDIYYLTGKDGKMYYAKNYTDHLSNINKYLR